MSEISSKTISRLSLYRRILRGLQSERVQQVYSHDLARVCRTTPAQVRRDIMAVGYSGSPRRGYDVGELARSIADLLDAPEDLGIALVGIGNLGRALLSYFMGRRLTIRAAFDQDAEKTNRVLHGCRCYAMSELPAIVSAQEIRVAILAVPAAQAQDVADHLLQAGVRGLLNFAPVPLRVPADAYVETIDLAVALEKVAFFARQRSPVP